MSRCPRQYWLRFHCKTGAASSMMGFRLQARLKGELPQGTVRRAARDSEERPQI
jgi:hypothetical protein